MTTDEITKTATTLSHFGIPVQSTLMSGTGHGLSDEGIAAGCDFLTSILPSVN